MCAYSSLSDNLLVRKVWIDCVCGLLFETYRLQNRSAHNDGVAVYYVNLLKISFPSDMNRANLNLDEPKKKKKFLYFGMKISRMTSFGFC